MSLIQDGRRRLNNPPSPLYRESVGTRALAKRRIPNFRDHPLRREATTGKIVDNHTLPTGTVKESTIWADLEAGHGHTRAKVDLGWKPGKQHD